VLFVVAQYFISQTKGEEHMNSQEKTFDAIAKLQDIELELLRLRNALDMANKIIDAQEARNFGEHLLGIKPDKT
jgi:hypothetical protein